MGWLNEFTKDDIIEWIKENTYRQPLKSELLSLTWERKSRQLGKESDALLIELESLKLCERDEYAKQYNSSQDIHEKCDLMKKMMPYDMKLKAWLKKDKSIQDRYDKLNILYRSIGTARNKETQRKRKTGSI